MNSMHAIMEQNLRLRARLTQFDGSREQACQSHPALAARDSCIKTKFAGAEWTINVALSAAEDRPDALNGCATFRVTAGSARSVAVALEWSVAPWSRDNFVMLPAAAYNGNRYLCRPYRYPPMVHEAADIGPAAPTLVTDVPRLSHEDGTPSRLQLLTGDLTTPCISYYAPHAGYAAILLTEQGSAFGNHGLTVEESPDRSQALLRIEAPGVRRETLYTMATTATPSWDRGADWTAETHVIIRFRLFVFPAHDVQELYDRFAAVRKDLTGPVTLRHTLPFSAAWHIVEEKYQRDNWCDAGYYRVGPHDAASSYSDWQVGWVGGGMVLFPLLCAGRPESQQRAVRNLEWMFTQAQHPSGLFHAVQHKGVAFGDGFDVPGTETWCMVRKQADALYFLIKAFHVLRTQDAHWRLPAHWEAGTRRLADRFVRTFRQFGQLGQYMDCHTGAVVVGGSTAAARAPGALALAGQYFEAAEYGEVAEALAARLDAQHVRTGITTGGPGEILKCPDSESAFAMLESFVVLYEVTGTARWLTRAEAMAAQCLTWCASYDYRFPSASWFGRLDMRSAGSVWANVQNKHSAPGICTLSGDSLFKLWRATGNRRYLETIQEIAHNLPQYLSRKDRPVGAPPQMQEGYMCERVNFSDWEGKDNVGGNLFGSCWCEISLMLTCVELPGLYIQPDTGFVCAFDHVDAVVVSRNQQGVQLRVSNPTPFPAQVKLMVETAAQAAHRVLGQNALYGCPLLKLESGETKVVFFENHEPLELSRIQVKVKTTGPTAIPHRRR